MDRITSINKALMCAISERENPIPNPYLLPPGRLTVTLMGSTRFMDVINDVHKQLHDNGVSVLAPPISNVVRVEMGYKSLDVDGNLSPQYAERKYMEALIQSHFAYIVNPGGYIGYTTSSEIGIADAVKLPIFSMEPIDPKLDEGHPTWVNLCRSTPWLTLETILEAQRDPSMRQEVLTNYEDSRRLRQPLIQQGLIYFIQSPPTLKLRRVKAEEVGFEPT